MSRTMAVVLFTDLVGSTELRGRLGEEAADELRRRHDQLLAQAVEANNGRVVKGLGDGIMATFAGASDAVTAAVAIQQGIDRLNRSGKAPVPLAVRVGLSAGDVAFEHEDVHGTPVIEAARLCAAAAGGDIVAAEVVRVLAGATTEQTYTSVGPLELKGLDHPVAAVRVEWEPAVVSSIPMPQLLTDVGRIFVGRDAELERLMQLWKEAAAGERRVALLAGEPGVGKTRLAAEVALRVHEEGGLVLAGRCDEDMGVPYQPFVEALRHFVDHTPVSELKERMGRYAGELGRLLPELTERRADLPPSLQSDPETERYRLFDAVAAWLMAAASESSVLLVLDDLQWAAKPTLLMLRHIVRTSSVKRLLILGTYRDTELAHDHPLIELVADLRREAPVDRLLLSGLDDVAVAAVVEQAAGQALDDDGFALAREIYRETEGNPFFVREVLRHLVETGAVERRQDGWVTRTEVDAISIPEGVRDVVGRRLSRLSDLTNQALRVAAVTSAEFEVGVLAHVTGFDEETLLAAVEEAAMARLITESSNGRFRFAHALVRATLYESLTSTRKIAVHRHVAEAIETIHAGELDDHLPALAHHWSRASAPAADAAKAVGYAIRAGDRALAQLAHDEAVTYYSQALQLFDAGGVTAGDPHRLDLLIALGEAQRRAGDAAHRQTFLDAARQAQERKHSDALVRAALANYRGFWGVTGVVDGERVAALEAALEAAGPDEMRARLLANLGAELQFAGDEERRRALSDEALTIARQLDDPPTLAHVLLARCSTLWEPGSVIERLAATADLLKVAGHVGDPALVGWTLVWRFAALVELADMEEADRCLAQMVSLAADLGQPVLRWVAAFEEVSRVLLAGQFSEAERLVQQAREFGIAAGQPDVHHFFGTQRFYIRFEQGRLAELTDRFETELTTSARPTTRAAIALAYCELDRIDDARRAFEPLRTILGDLPVDPGWSVTVSNSAAVAASLGDQPIAALLLDLLLAYADQLAYAGLVCTGSVSHYVALLATTLGHFDDAEDRFSAAEATHARIGAPTWLARTRLEWARMLLIRRKPGDTDQARDLLGQALATARDLGLANVERRVTALLQDCP